MKTMLELQSVGVQFGSIRVVDDVSVSLREGEWLMLVGPNGAGKSTMINAISQGVPYSGKIILNGKDVKKYKPTEMARQIGVLSQQHQSEYGYTVREIVSLGRYAYRRNLFSMDAKDEDSLIDNALELTGMRALADKKITELSGGEIQRTFLAQIFAQDPSILLLDEPANHLDLQYQKQVFGLIEDWLKEPGRAVISVVHDLNLVRRYGTDALLMHRGKKIAAGEINSVLRAERLEKIYEMDVYGWMREMLNQWSEP